MDEAGLTQNSNANRVLGVGAQLPFKDKTLDLVMVDNVFEHLDDPLLVLRDCHRCLRETGALVFLCPNRFSYIALASSITPHWFHAKFKLLTLSVAEADTFPTYYRLNNIRRITKLANQVGFEIDRIESFVGWPTYWEFSDLLHRFFVLVHRFLEWLPSGCHITLVGVLRRKSQDSRSHFKTFRSVTRAQARWKKPPKVSSSRS
jgi:SAM-dependent methyltransferase